MSGRTNDRRQEDRRPQRPTIRDVAALAGVSPSTVSNVLNGRPVLHPATKARVLEAIAELGYERSVAARGLRARSMPVLGLLIEDDSRMAMRDPVHAQLLAGLLERARQRDLGVSVFAAAPEAHDAAVLRFVASGHAAGAVLSLQGAEGSRPELMRRLASLGVPLVLFERGDAPAGIGSVVADNAGGARALCEYLNDLGHRDYLYLGSSVSWPGPERRLEAFATAASQGGGAVRVERVPGWTIDFAHAAVRSLLQDPLPSAIVAANDHLAAGALAAATEAGFRVPKDLSIAGFSDLEVAVRVSPRLTTVAFDPAAEGELAADLLISRIAGHDTVDHLTVPAHVIVRESTAAAAR